MNWLKKIWLFQVDRLIYYYPNEKGFELKPEINGLPLIEKSGEYTLKQDGKSIHRSRVFKSSHLLKSFHFKDPFVVIGDCVTSPDFRGKGIYPQVIRFLGQKYSRNFQVYILVDPSNAPSIAGIEKAGYVFMGRIQGIRLFFFYIKKRISILKN